MVHLLGLIWLLSGPAGASAQAAPPPRTSPECITARTEARYRNYGYDHLVHLANGCARAAQCAVSTNVNPKAQHVTLAAGEKKTVLTFRGSPARVFKAKVECQLK